MNERIEKLARQVDACYIPYHDMWQMDTETLEKLAELIVKETMQVVANNLPQNTYLDVADAVIEHFKE